MSGGRNHFKLEKYSRAVKPSGIDSKEQKAKVRLQGETLLDYVCRNPSYFVVLYKNLLFFKAFAWFFLLSAISAIAVSFGLYVVGIPIFIFLYTALFLQIAFTGFATTITVKTLLSLFSILFANIIIFAGAMLYFDVLIEVPVKEWQERQLGDDLLKYLYLSGMAFTSIGFGDVVPVSSWSRLLTVIEGILGSLFMAVITAKCIILLSSAQEFKARMRELHAKYLSDET